MLYNYSMIETKKRSLILNLILGAIVLLIAFLFWPSEDKFTQSNKIDRTKTQIKIKEKRINIRKLPNIDSEDLGDVYRNEIYTVLSHLDTDEYYWYHIKTNQGIEGYIASNREKEYVEVISGYVDRTPPKISSTEEFLVFVNDERNYDAITCEDDYSKCTLSYDDSNPEEIVFTAIDEDDNTSTFSIKYYNVYNLYSEYSDNSSKLNAKFTKDKVRDKYTINTYYTTNKTINKHNKSLSYNPIIDFYDENFNKLEDVFVKYSNSDLPGYCINDENLALKPEFELNDLLSKSTLCMSFTFEKTEEMKYVSFGFNGVENYDNNYNYLASYYSKTFVLN